MARLMRVPMKGFSLCPEGEYVFGIYDVIYDPDFGQAQIKMVTADGKYHTERFKLLSGNELNDAAISALSSLARAATGINDAEDFDPLELKGHYIRATIVHNHSKTDPEKVFANLGREKYHAEGFDTQPTERVQQMMAQSMEAPAQETEAPKESEAPKGDSADNLASLLGM